MVDLETGIGQTVFQFLSGKNLDQRHQTKESSNRGDNLKKLHRISKACCAGDENTPRFEHLMNLGDDLFLVFHEVQNADPKTASKV